MKDSNVFTKFAEFNDKIYYILKRLFELATSNVRDQDVIIVLARHIRQTGSLN